MSYRRTLGSAAILCLAGGCSTFSETHYFRSADSRGRPVNYYRVRVEGGVAVASSRYISGYFDERAVDTYFNEYVQPDKGQLVPPAGGAATRPAGGSAAETIEPLAPNLKDRRLVLLLSSNSDDIATGISAIAGNNALAATLQKVVTRGQTDAAATAATAENVEAARAGVLSDRGDKAVEAATAGAGDRDAVRSNLLAYAEELAKFLGGRDVRFKDAKDAEAWLQQHNSQAKGD